MGLCSRMKLNRPSFTFPKLTTWDKSRNVWHTSEGLTYGDWVQPKHTAFQVYNNVLASVNFINLFIFLKERAIHRVLQIFFKTWTGQGFSTSIQQHLHLAGEDQPHRWLNNEPTSQESAESYRLVLICSEEEKQTEGGSCGGCFSRAQTWSCQCFWFQDLSWLLTKQRVAVLVWIFGKRRFISSVMFSISQTIYLSFVPF